MVDLDFIDESFKGKWARVITHDRALISAYLHRLLRVLCYKSGRFRRRGQFTIHVDPQFLLNGHYACQMYPLFGDLLLCSDRDRLSIDADSEPWSSIL